MSTMRDAYAKRDAEISRRALHIFQPIEAVGRALPVSK
jgi:hypothetical protein